MKGGTNMPCNRCGRGHYDDPYWRHDFEERHDFDERHDRDDFRFFPIFFGFDGRRRHRFDFDRDDFRRRRHFFFDRDEFDRRF
jgi:hypothetical protein